MKYTLTRLLVNTDLPVATLLPDLLEVLAVAHEVVLHAEPGAGKTSLVPLALLNAQWRQGQKILVLEPRRLAARSAAARMAALLGETVGDTVGYRIRLERKISQNTIIEVITEGVLIRLLQNDPSLEGVGAVIFDEFHERNLDADLGLALTLQTRKLFREPGSGGVPLKLVIMSATLDDEAVANLVGSESAARILSSEGRQYPVQVHYSAAATLADNIVAKVVTTLQKIVRTEQGSTLVFLPGVGEIRQLQQRLHEVLGDDDSIMITPLYGDLSLAAQRLAIAPLPIDSKAKRKVVLATAIAESSLTIDGITVVVDAGLRRHPVFDANTGMTRLHTSRLSQAASIQRMGRAGRMQPGSCYRLWSESQQQQLSAQTPAEILQADLAPLALQLLKWGVSNPAELDWLDQPPASAYQQALELLQRLGAAQQTSKGWTLSKHGDAMSCLPSHPRLAHLLLMAKKYGLQQQACDVASLLSDRAPTDNRIGVELATRLALLQQGNKSGEVKRLRQQSRQFYQLCASISLYRQSRQTLNITKQQQLSLLLAWAYPDRIAQRRQPNSTAYRLANGRAATLSDVDTLQQVEWIVVANLGGRHGQANDRIYLATALDCALFNSVLADLVTEQEVVSWDAKRERFCAEVRQTVGALTLTSKPLTTVSAATKLVVLLDLVAKRGMPLLPWNDELRQWQARILLLRKLDLQQNSSTSWPDVSDANLLATSTEWLGPYLQDINHIGDFAKLELPTILSQLLPWPQPNTLEQLAPRRIKVASGSSATIDYLQQPPVLSVKLQEMFGCQTTPAIANGRQRLLIHLLSPARRPLAVTQDLLSFWRNGYNDVRKDMKGRYPKHPWPDNPLQVVATATAKPRNTLDKQPR